MGSAERKPSVDRGILIVAGLIGAALTVGYVDTLVSAGSTNGHRFGSLVDQDGHVFATNAASHSYKLVAFGFTQCPDVCPTTLSKVHRVLDTLGTTTRPLTALFVTLDPVHDTPQALQQYTAAFDERIVGLTGDAQEVRAFASTYGVYPPGEEQSEMREAITHSPMLYLLGRDNEMLAAYQPVTGVETIAQDISRRQQGQ